MNRQPIVAVLLCLASVAAVVVFARSGSTPADIILSNGKVVTVDGRFSIASAVAIRGERIVAVGSDRDVAALAGAATRRIDLAGKDRRPGLIDNHMHLLRAGTTWQREVRLDGVPSRQQALDLLRARAKSTPPGEWIYTLGGWTVDQFADDEPPFTREELDRAVREHPVFLQASYYRGYANTLATKSLGLTDPTGVVDEASLRGVAARLPGRKGERVESSTRQMTSGPQSRGPDVVRQRRMRTRRAAALFQWSQKGELNVRVFCIIGQGRALRAGDAALPRIRNIGCGTRRISFVDEIASGETCTGRCTIRCSCVQSNPQPEQLAQWRRIATEVAKAGLPLHVHANLTNTIGAFLDQIELIDREIRFGTFAGRLPTSTRSALRISRA